MRTNTAIRPDHFTHEGAPARRIDDEAQLRRSLMACLLWESEFYEDGQAIAGRIAGTAARVDPVSVAAMAREARHVMHLRHAPLLLLSVLAERSSGAVVADAIADLLTRADEPGELLAIHAARYDMPIKACMSHAMRKGIARAIARFDAYQLAKYDRDVAVRLRDVIRLVHPRPRDAAHAALYKATLDRNLAPPDTWEVALSGGADKRATFERLLAEGRLGYLALLRNLRNMAEAGVDEKLIRDAIIARKGAGRVLPFRYVAAARAAPRFEPYLDEALSESVADMPALSGRTAVLVDVSGSMEQKLSARSDMTRMDAAAALASVLHGSLRVFTFSNDVVEVPPRRGMAGIDAVKRSQPHHMTYLGQAVAKLNGEVPHDRLIVITDEQAAGIVPAPRAARAYVINVASARNGVGYGPWTHVDGWSEGVLRYIHEVERAGG
jgi:hypothetical protein